MQKREGTKKFRKSDIGLLVVFIAILVGIFILINNSLGKPDELTPSGFHELLENEKLKSINIKPIGGDNRDFFEVHGIYLNADKEEKPYTAVLSIEYVNENLLSTEGMLKYNINPKIVKLVTVDWFSIIFMVVLPIALIVGFVMFISKNANNSNNKAFEFTKTRAKLSKKSSTTFKDVAGCDEEKEELEEIIDFLKSPKKYFEIGARIPKGVLLIGPPGTGKTLMARAVAGEAKVPFYAISGSDFVEMFVGVGASRVRDMFKAAKQTAPCIVFIDEIDAVGRQRGAGVGGGHDEREQTLNQLLVELDGFDQNSGVIVMAATNRADILDPALLRPGRFDRQIRISNPDVKGRTEIMQVHARNKKLSPKINLEDIARRTPGFSGADLENLLNEAALLAARENRREIKIYDIDEAIDRVLLGPAKRSRKYSDKEKEIISYHEAGHAVLGVKLDSAEIVQKVTIVPRGDTGGYSMMTPEEEKFLQTKQGLLDTITGLLGGRASEELMTTEITTGAHNDFQKATLIARAMVTEYGMSELGPVQYEQRSQTVFLGRDYMNDKNFSDQVALEIDHAVRNIIESCYQRAKTVLTEHKELLTSIAMHLMEIETLTKEDIYEIVDTGKLGWWEKKKAKDEAKKIATEKEAELQEIYQKQLKAMEEAKKASGDTSPVIPEETVSPVDAKEIFREALDKDNQDKSEKE
ncbi:MAG TPA: ATP-dependent zinc metalloprotease FtsH [Bacilli bacterium]|nr:ATP-dependent zinc metalloprotease FtsH [Bacilli bacterium]